MASEIEIISNGKYYIRQIMYLPNQPYEVGKYSDKNPVTGHRAKGRFLHTIKTYKKLANAKKLYNKLTEKK